MGEDNPRIRNVAREVDSEASSSIRDTPDRTPARAHRRDDSDLSDLEQDTTASTPPRFIQDQRAWRHWRWVPYPVRRSLRAAATWSEGPADNLSYRIKPLFPRVQHAPLALLDRFLPMPKFKWWRVGLAFLWLGLWLMSFALVKRHGLVSSEVQGWGSPGDIGCGNTYWVPGNSCGLDGNDCRPFNGSGFAFRCPASCANYKVLNPRAVGTTEVIYQTLVVGGPSQNSSQPVYRGDSFICSAAIHAGVITNLNGGCGVVRLVGKHKDFEGSERNGIASVGFNSNFPLAFTFDQGIDCRSVDVRWYLLGISVAFSTVFSLFVTSPAMFFFSIFTGLFWHVGLASDPPSYSSIPGLISTLIGRFLPAMLAGWVIFDKMGPRRTLTGLDAQIEKTVLWLGGAWVGALENITLNGIPIQRLTPHDLEQQPGAKAALAIIVIVLVCIAASQIYFFRQEGRLLGKLQLYILFGVGIGILAALPNLKLRIHHYILALLLLPGTAMQTRPSLLYQGILVGLFINGIARWNWDPILQTAAALQGDAQQGSPLPSLLEPIISMVGAAAAAAVAANSTLANTTASATHSTITFRWKPAPGPRYDGVSVLVNDVERYRGYFADFDEDSVTGGDSFVWERKAGLEIDEYFRFAYMEGSQSDDYTKAGVWNAQGGWVNMEPGPSRVKSRSLDGERRLEKR